VGRGEYDSELGDIVSTALRVTGTAARSSMILPNEYNVDQADGGQVGGGEYRREKGATSKMSKMSTKT
jgi:hypothetical protein